MSTQPLPDAIAGTEYHWFITVQTETGRTVTHDGVHRVTAADTHASVFKQVWAGVAVQLGGGRSSVLAFGLVPNAIIPGGVQ